MSQSKTPIVALEAALRENWQFINHSLLCYTVLACHPVTAVWCEAAQLVAFANSTPEKPKNALLYLIPTLQCIESIHASYPDLKPVFDAQSKQWNIDLKQIISSHIINDAGTHLLPVSTLLVLSSSAGIPVLYNPYIDDETAKKSVAFSENELSRLVDFSNDTKAIYDAKRYYDVLGTDEENLLGQLNRLRQQMKDNSVQGSGKEKVAGAFFDQALYNFSCWYDKVDDKSAVPKGVQNFIDKIQLFSAPSPHDFKMQSIENIFEIFNRLPDSDRKNLSPFLQPLQALLQMNKTKESENQLEEARKTIYKVLKSLGIISLANTSTKTPIFPDLSIELKDALNMLKRDAFKNNNQENPQTCLITLARELDSAIKENEPVLSQIGISQSMKAHLTEQALKNFEELKNQFRQKLARNEALNGHDKLGINRKQIDEFQLNIEFNQAEDFIFLDMLSAQEISEFCADNHTAKSLLQAQNLERLTFFIMGASPLKIKAFFEGFSRLSPDYNVRKSLKLGPLLKQISFIVDDDCWQYICEKLQDYLTGFCVKQTEQFKNSFDYLSEPKRKILFESIKNKLPAGVTVKNFSNIFGLLLMSDCRDELFQLLKPRLLKLGTSAKALETICYKSCLSSEQRNTLIPTDPLQLSALVKSIEDFKDLYKISDVQGRMTLLNSVAIRLAEMIGSFKDFAKLLSDLYTEDLHFIYEQMKNRIPEWTIDLASLFVLIPLLTTNQCCEMLSAIKPLLPSLISSWPDFYRLLSATADKKEAQSVVFDALDNVNRWASLPCSSKDIFSLFRLSLTPYHYSFLFNALKMSLPAAISLFVDFEFIFRFLKQDDRNAFFEIMKPHLSKLTWYLNDLQCLKDLTPDQKMIALKAIKTTLPTKITSGNHLARTLCLTFIDSNMRSYIYTLMKPHLQKLSLNKIAFNNILRHLLPAEREDVFERTKKSITRLVKSSQDLGLVLQFLTPKDFLWLCNKLKRKLPKLLLSTNCCAQLLAHLNLEQYNLIMPYIVKVKPAIFRDKNSLSYLINNCNGDAEKIYYICTYEDALSQCIKSVNDLAFFLNSPRILSPMLLIERFPLLLKQILKSPDDIVHLGLYLHNEEYYWLLMKVNPLISENNSLQTFINNTICTLKPFIFPATNSSLGSCTSMTDTSIANSSFSFFSSSRKRSFEGEDGDELSRKRIALEKPADLSRETAVDKETNHHFEDRPALPFWEPMNFETESMSIFGSELLEDKNDLCGLDFTSFI